MVCALAVNPYLATCECKLIPSDCADGESTLPLQNPEVPDPGRADLAEKLAARRKTRTETCRSPSKTMAPRCEARLPGRPRKTFRPLTPVVAGLDSSNSRIHGHNRFDIRGTYMLSNLLQELSSPKEYGRKQIILDEARLNENPVNRLSRLIRELFLGRVDPTDRRLEH